MIDLAKFRPQRRNANKHTQRGLGMLDKAMSEDGYVAPITVAADGETIDGSARLERAAERFAGVEPLVVEHDGTRPVVMVRTDIQSADEPIAKRIALRANRIAEVDLSWDAGELEQLRAEMPDIIGGLFRDDEVPASFVPDSDIAASENSREPMVAVVVAVSDVELVETALSMAMEPTRGRALMKICQEFLRAR